MNYSKIYADLITKATNRKLDGYFERHHIHPRCMGGKDDPINIVELTPEEHYLAHLLLVKIYPEHTKLAFALARMSNKSNKLYGWVRRKISEEMKTNNPNAGGVARLKYIAEHGVPINSKYEWSEEGRKVVVDRMTTNNPCLGIKPWNHPRATIDSKAIWSRADQYYKWWKFFGQSYYAMAKSFNEMPCMPHNNMIKYFKNGWVPTEDNEWLAEFKI